MNQLRLFSVSSQTHTDRFDDQRYQAIVHVHMTARLHDFVDVLVINVEHVGVALLFEFVAGGHLNFVAAHQFDLTCGSLLIDHD